MSGPTYPLSPQDEKWLDLRRRLAHSARDLHFIALSNDAVSGSVLLAIAGRFADLAMSIPMSSSANAERNETIDTLDMALAMAHRPVAHPESGAI